MDYTGYVYIWRDKKRNMFYIGSHHGKISDSYICSSKWMKNAYNKRPDDFKMRILQYINGTINDLQIAEQKWLDLIKDHELSISKNVMEGSNRYYNMKKSATGGNGKANKGNKNLGGHNSLDWFVIDPTGKRYYIKSHLGRFYKQNNISGSALYAAYRANRDIKRGPMKGWKLTAGYLPRETILLQYKPIPKHLQKLRGGCRSVKSWIIISKDGGKREITNLSKYCREHNIIRGHLYHTLKTKQFNDDGFKLNKR